ncbi:hypothetical protein ACFSR9_06985 [Deinococcus taklimakanensis]|uniref:Uncharacterized protein n=1 Tax=Deinococcus taklimakanensis TaxID=536443 RepID=A0ABW5P2T7_9DEIO
MSDEVSLSWLEHVKRDAASGNWLEVTPEHASLLETAQSLIDHESWKTRHAEEVAGEILKWRPAQERQTVDVALWLLVRFDGRFDVLQAALPQKAWFVIHKLQPMMPSLLFTPEQIASLLEQVAELTRGDLAAGFALQPFGEWAERNPALAMQVIRLRPTLPPDAALTLTVHAVRGGLSEEGQRTMMGWRDPTSAQHGIFLGTLPELVAHGLITCQAALDLIEAALDGEWSLAGLAWHGFRHLLGAGVGERELSMVAQLVDDPRPEIRLVLAQFLAGNGDGYFSKYRTPLLLNALDTDSEHLGVIKALDLLLAQVSDDQPGFVGDYLAQWTERHSYDAVDRLLKKTFKTTYHHVASRQPAFWGQLAGEWLLKRPKLLQAASSLLHDHHTDFQSLAPLSNEQFVTLTERLLCTALEGKAQLKLLAELERSAADAVRVKALQVACSEIATNFPIASRRFEEEQAESNPVMAKALQERRESYWVPREGRTALHEFAPPVERLRKWHAYERRAQTEASRRVEDEGNFVFSKLVRKVAVGRGDSWSVTQHDGTLGPVQPFSSFSYEMELPRLGILEPEEVIKRRIKRLQRTDRGNSA